MELQKNCFICGKSFITTRPYQKNCSPKCCDRMRHLNTNKKRDLERSIQKQKPKICKECGKDFFVKAFLRQKYCSPLCLHQASYKAYKQKHPGRMGINNRKFRIKYRKQTIQHLGGKCNRCGETDWRVLQANHINGGGRKDLLSKGSQRVHREILQGKRNGEFNLLCANCNILYEYEVGRRFSE